LGFLLAHNLATPFALVASPRLGLGHSTSTKLILKEDFINYVQNKVVQLPNNAKLSKEITFFD
jgi:hypothetical protein